MSEWVSVKKFLPEKNQPVLVWTSDNYCYPSIGYYDLVTYPETGWRNEEFIEIDVSHWIPLPLPPEQDIPIEILKYYDWILRSNTRFFMEKDRNITLLKNTSIDEPLEEGWNG